MHYFRGMQNTLAQPVLCLYLHSFHLENMIIKASHNNNELIHIKPSTIQLLKDFQLIILDTEISFNFLWRNKAYPIQKR